MQPRPTPDLAPPSLQGNAGGRRQAPPFFGWLLELVGGGKGPRLSPVPAGRCPAPVSTSRLFHTKSLPSRTSSCQGAEFGEVFGAGAGPPSLHVTCFPEDAGLLPSTHRAKRTQRQPGLALDASRKCPVSRVHKAPPSREVKMNCLHWGGRQRLSPPAL